MSYREVTMYQIVCDVCGYVDDEGDYFAWGDKEQAMAAAADSDWHVDGDRALCPECWLNDHEELPR